MHKNGSIGIILKYPEYPYTHSMKEIRIVLEDKEYAALLKIKRGRTWKELLISELKKKVKKI
ncbi:MAG: hypothetical protein L6408_04290 [Nanoarchaeota archaeon]|nr:hypothetical protein [Nanoarchaeota archaeon]